MPCALLASTGSCPDWSLPKELERKKKLRIMVIRYKAFPYKYRIRFLSSSTAQTRQGVQQHSMM